MQQSTSASQAFAWRSAGPRWAYIVVTGVYIIALAMMGSPLRTHFGFPLDDSWIHQTVGRNFATFGSLGYLPHQRSSGSTSLLWTLILSFNYAVLPSLSPVLYCLAINTVCLILIGLLILRLALRDGMSPALAVLWAAAPACNGNFLWLAFIGMEHLLFITLSLASIVLWIQTDRRPSLRTAAAAGLTLGLLCMTRPEGIVLAAVLLPLFSLARRTLRETALAGSITAVFAALPFTVNLITSGALLPVTFKGRQWMYFAAHFGGTFYRMELIGQWIMRPLKALLPIEGSSLTSSDRMAVFGITAVLLALCGLALYTFFKRRYIATLVFCAWTVIHSLLYVIVLPISGHGGRYQPFLLLLLTPLVAAGIYSGIRLLPSTSQQPALAASVLFLCLVGALSLHLWRSILANGIEHIHLSHAAMAAYLNASHIDQEIAVFDIGRIGYDRGGNIIDLGGLTDENYIYSLYNNQVPQYLKSHKIALLVLPVDTSDRSVIAGELNLMDNPDIILKPLHRDCSPYSVWRNPWVETRLAFQCQELFRATIR